MADYIPEEILVRVLKRLSVELLLRSRCVCKWWKQLIDSPSLVLDHLALQKPRFFVMNVDYDEPTFLLLDPQILPLFDTLPYSFEKRPCINFVLMGTLHGIVCFYEYTRMTSGIYLWNPSMRKLLNVPVPEYLHYYRDDDPEYDLLGHVPFTYSAFWIDPLTKRFKMVVVKMVHQYKEFQKYGAIYSSIEGNWKEISPRELKSIGNCLLCNNDPGVVMRKVAYWRAFYDIRHEEDEYLRYRAVLICFDFEQERFDSIEGPSVTYDPSNGHPSLFNWQGSLSLVYLDREKRCDFYSRQEGSWVNLFSINLTSNISQVCCFLKEMGENIKILLALTTEFELILIDSRGGCVTLKSGDDKPFFDGYMAHDFVESLVFP